jgi:LacI family transcriptional regulator
VGRRSGSTGRPTGQSGPPVCAIIRRFATGDACIGKRGGLAPAARRVIVPRPPYPMKNSGTIKTGKARRVAISLELEWGHKRHLEVYAGCQKYADEVGWHCTINPAADRALMRGGDEVPFDGIIARATKSLAAAARQMGVPLVNVWMNSPVQDLPSVLPDVEASGAMAAEHLLSRGFRQFGYLGFLREIDSRRQVQGFREVIRQAGFPCTVHRFSSTAASGQGSGWEGFVAGLEEWINSWETPIGILVCQDLISRHLIDVCRTKGLHISQDVAIVSTHNESEICGAPAPSLTSIDLGYGQIGYRAAAMLDLLMSGSRPPAAPELVPPAELVPRQSTDVLAADDPLVARALRFISENGHRRIQVKHVAGAVATTRRTLERRFRDSVGRSIAGEITRLRLERAKRRMVETDASMKDVATDAGFRSADHFYKVFARVEHGTPSQFREQHQKAFPERL